MRSLLLICLSLIALSANSANMNVTCYSGGRLIYSGNASEAYYDEGVLVFHEKKTNKDVFVFAECIVKL